MEIRRQEQDSVQRRDSVSSLAAEKKHKGKIEHRSTWRRALSPGTEKLQFVSSLHIFWMLLKMMTLHLYLSTLSFSSVQTSTERREQVTKIIILKQKSSQKRAN